MPSPKTPTPLMRALPLALATLLGAALALAATWLFDAPPAPVAAPLAAPDEAAPAPPPEPVDPAPARALAVAALVEAGVPHAAIEHGVYPLRGPGRAPAETIPLVGFTCPAERGCAPLEGALAAAALPAGLTLVEPIGGDRPGRPLHRALSDGPNPALALRGHPPGPRLTVIIGDVGREPALLDPLIALDPDVTFAIMANAPHAPAVAARLAETGREILAHLPLQPAPPALPDGPDALTTDDDPTTTATKARALLDRVPGAAGADTHQGDRFTPSRPHVAALLDVLAERGMFFIDGRHSDASVALPIAAAQGIRAAARTHDLDHGDGPIDTRLRAIEVALVLDGQAIVTLTPTPEAITALAAWTLTLRARGIHLLRASEIVR